MVAVGCTYSFDNGRPYPRQFVRRHLVVVLLYYVLVTSNVQVSACG
jgi:hypothetical protein